MNKLVEILTGIPQEIKTLEVDTEKKIFKLNGIDFGKGCEEFVISCTGGEGFKIRMELSKRIIYVPCTQGDKEWCRQNAVWKGVSNGREGRN